MASRPLRTLLTLLAVALGVAMLVAVATTNATIDASLNVAAARLIGRVDVEMRSFGDSGFTRQTTESIERLPEVALAAPTVRKRVFYRAPAAQGFVELVGLDPALARRLDHFGVKEGVFLPDESLRNVMVLASWAKARGLQPGDFIELVSYTGLQPFQIVALLDDAGLGETGYGQMVYVSLKSGQELFNMADRVDRVAIQLQPGATVAQLEARLREVMSQDYLVVPASERARGLRESVAALQYSLGLFGILPLLVGAFFILNSFQLSIAERVRELALLRVGGATPGQVLRLVLWEASGLGVVGSALGVALGIALAALLVWWLETTGEVRLLAWEVPRGAAVAGFGAGIVVTLVAALLPAMNAARMSPLEALGPRNLTGVEGRPVWTGVVLAGLVLALALVLAGLMLPEWRSLGAVGLVLLFVSVIGLVPALLGPVSALLMPILRRLPGDGLLGARNLTRNRARTAVTMTGLVVGFALTVGVGGLAESAAQVGRDRAEALFASRYAIVSPVAQPGEFVQDFAAVPGVARVSPIRYFPAIRERELVDVVALEPDAYIGASAWRGRQDAAWRTALAKLASQGHGVLVPASLAATWGVRAGDTVRLRANDREETLLVIDVIEAVFPSDDDRGALVVPWTTMTRWTGRNEWNYLNVLVAPGQEGPAVERALVDAAALYGLQAVTTDQIAGAIRRSLERVVGLVNAMLGVGILIAALAILNTMLMNVYDRVREIALLRATGMDPAQTARMVLLEATAMGLVAMIVGSVLGLGVGWLVLQLAQTTEFQAPYVFPTREIVAALVVALVLVPLAGAYPARYAARLNVVDALTGMR